MITHAWYRAIVKMSPLIHSCPCILRPPFQPETWVLKLKAILKWTHMYTEIIEVVSLMSGLKIPGSFIYIIHIYSM